MNTEKMTTEALQQECLDMTKASFDLFSRNAKLRYNECADELAKRCITEIPNLFGPIAIHKFTL